MAPWQIVPSGHCASPLQPPDELELLELEELELDELGEVELELLLVDVDAALLKLDEVEAPLLDATVAAAIASRGA